MTIVSKSYNDIVGAGLKPIGDVEDRLNWFEILSSEQAEIAEKLSRTGIRHFYDMEAKKTAGLPAPHRWFMLLDNRDPDFSRAAVLVAIPGPGVERATFAPFHTTGFRNAPPYPDYANAIAILARRIGVDIPPDYQGRPLHPDAAGLSPIERLTTEANGDEGSPGYHVTLRYPDGSFVDAPIVSVGPNFARFAELGDEPVTIDTKDAEIAINYEPGEAEAYGPRFQHIDKRAGSPGPR